MLVYTADKAEFIQDVQQNRIDQKIEERLAATLGRRVGYSEKASWMNSMMYMANLLRDDDIPADAGVAIEFNIPNTAKRIDFILSGESSEGTKRALIIELKQWQQVKPMPDVEQLLQYEAAVETHKVRTYLGGGLHDTTHPSYQASSYKSFLTDFNANVTEIPIELKSCAYLHNYTRVEHDPLFQPYFTELLKDSPLYCRSDMEKLQDFIKHYIPKGDQKDTLVLIDKGEIRPSKSLQDSLLAMLHGKEEFVLIDEQKIIYEKILAFAKKKDQKKRVFIVTGGPGTGKTVVAINLLVSLINHNQMCAYVTKNMAPRNVFQAKLIAGKKKRYIDTLFKSSTAFIQGHDNDFATLLVDEAHRLNQRSQLGPRIIGEDQIKEIIATAKTSVFFIDEDQRVTARDYGTIERIRYWAAAFNARVVQEALVSQFRCAGSDGYLVWLDDILGLQHDTAHPTLKGVEYDFNVFDNPTDLKEEIERLNEAENKARLVAGYCWNWVSKKDPTAIDIIIDDFALQWNLSKDPTFAISEGSINQVGCIHTTQGLEFSYVGVIIGDDLRYENGEVITDYTKRAKTDTSLHGLLGPAKKGDAESLEDIDRIIRNTYRTLMSRGMKGCYVYCTDKALANYIRKRIGNELEYPFEGDTHLWAAEKE